MQLDTIKVRALTNEEIVALAPEDEILVADSGWTVTVLVPAKVNPKGGYYLRQETLEVTSIYGSTFWVKFGKVFVADDSGIEMPLVRTAGTRLSSTLFFPGLTEEEAKERLARALTSEFGKGIVQVWNLRSGPVKDVLMDVWEVRNDWVPDPAPTGRRKNASRGQVKPVERRLVHSGILEAHTQHFVGTARPGWQIEFQPHDPSARPAGQGADTF